MTLESFTQRTMIWDLTRDRRGKTTSRRWPLPMPDVKKSRHLEAALSGGGKLLAVRNADRSVSLWDLRQKKERVTFPAVQDRDVHGLAVSPDGRWVAARLTAPKAPNVVVLWEVARPARPPAQLRTRGPSRSDLQFSADGSLLLYVVAARVVRREVPGLKATHTAVRLDLDLTGPVVLGPDGNFVVGLGDGGRFVAVWDAGTGRRKALLAFPATTLYGLAIPRAEVAGPLARLLGVADPRIYSLSVTRDGSRVAAACDDARLRLWQVPPANPKP